MKDDGSKVIVLPGDDDESVEKLEIVRSIARDYFNGIRGLPGIAQFKPRGRTFSECRNTRNGVRVPGRWTVGTVRALMENPLYKAVPAWRRTAEGEKFRWDATSPDCRRSRVSPTIKRPAVMA